MGDDAELYWEMENDPFFWDCVEEYNSSKPLKKNKSNVQRHKKQNTAVFIDGENISSKKAEKIMQIAKKQGELHSARVYGMQKDPHTKNWTDKARKLNIKDIRLSGEHEKNKADKKIQKDAKKEIAQVKNVDVVCIATSDKGYTDTVRELRKQGKRVVIIGEEKTPVELRQAASKFVKV